jgi:hypothetical protein
VQILRAVDGGDDRIPGGAQVEQVLLAGLVGPAGELVVDTGAVGDRSLAERLVRLLVGQDRPAVADDDAVEGAHQRGRVPRVAQGQVEVLAQAGGRMSSSQ